MCTDMHHMYVYVLSANNFVTRIHAVLYILQQKMVTLK